VKLVVISDTHELHEALGVLEGDILIHCGDSAYGFNRSDAQVDRLDDWFGRQHFERILVIGGNHDFELQKRVETNERLFRNADYLQDKAFQFRGINFYGAPWIPELSGWAFHLPADELCNRWDLIPDNTDVLITHTPPANILDRNSRGKACGCPNLRKRVIDLKPRVHCFGHVHASGGTIELKDTKYINASLVNSQYELVRRPQEFEI
jgi:Icc-related predicted phosphoesterase